MSQPHDFPFDITDVAELLHLRIRRPSRKGFMWIVPSVRQARENAHQHADRYLAVQLLR